MIEFWNIRRIGYMILLLVIVASIGSGLSRGLSDTDYYWHLKTGEVIFAVGALPTIDPFSFGAEGQPWVLHEWLFQLGLYLLHRAFGATGVIYAAVLIAWLTWCLVYATADTVVRRPGVMLVLALLFGAGMAGLVAPRPQLVSYLFFAVYCRVFFAAKYEGRLRWLLIAPPLMVLWVNMHGAYAIGVVSMAAFTICEGMNHLFATDRRPAQVRLCLGLAGTTVAVLLASLINPHGIDFWLYPFQVSSMLVNATIREWQTVLSFYRLGKWFLGGGIVFFLLMILRERRPDATEFLVPTLLFAAGLLHSRHAAFASMAMTLFSASAIRDGAIETLGHVLRRCAPLPRVVPVPPRAVALAGWGLALFSAYAFVEVADRPSYRSAEGAAEYVADAGLKGRMFNDYGDGGYLISRFYPERKVFVDGRADLFGDQFLRDYFGVVGGRSDHRPYFEKWGFDYAIVDSNGPLRRMLELEGRFVVVYDDEVRAVMVRRDGAESPALPE